VLALPQEVKAGRCVEDQLACTDRSAVTVARAFAQVGQTDFQVTD
jgi:hypothetical protein